MEYRKMTDAQLAMIMVKYITRVNHLRKMIGYYLDSSDNGSLEANRIKVFYKQLKYELREDASYLELMRNKKGSNLYMYYFSPSIREASAWGFCRHVNSAINQQLYGTVSDAYYKLTKYLSLEQWGNIR